MVSCLVLFFKIATNTHNPRLMASYTVIYVAVSTFISRLFIVVAIDIIAEMSSTELVH